MIISCSCSCTYIAIVSLSIAIATLGTTRTMAHVAAGAAVVTPSILDAEWLPSVLVALQHSKRCNSNINVRITPPTTVTTPIVFKDTVGWKPSSVPWPALIAKRHELKQEKSSQSLWLQGMCWAFSWTSFHSMWDLQFQLCKRWRQRFLEMYLALQSMKFL